MIYLLVSVVLYVERVMSWKMTISKYEIFHQKLKLAELNGEFRHIFKKNEQIHHKKHKTSPINSDLHELHKRMRRTNYCIFRI